MTTEEKVQTELHYVDEENDKISFDNSELKEYKLPPYPEPFRPWSEQEKKIRYNGDLKDFKQRIHDKLFKIWMFWSALRCDASIEELVSKEEVDKTSDAYRAKALLVDIIDQFAKTLVDTDLIPELAYLCLEPDEFKKRFIDTETKEKKVKDKVEKVRRTR